MHGTARLFATPIINIASCGNKGCCFRRSKRLNMFVNNVWVPSRSITINLRYILIIFRLPKNSIYILTILHNKINTLPTVWLHSILTRSARKLAMRDTSSSIYILLNVFYITSIWDKVHNKRLVWFMISCKGRVVNIALLAQNLKYTLSHRHLINIF